MKDYVSLRAISRARFAGGLSLDRLRTLVEVVDAGGIAPAASSDPVRQSQYSRQIKELEAAFERKLTRRAGRLLAPTPVGERLAEITREFLLALEDLSNQEDETVRDIRLGAGDSMLQWLVIPQAHAFQKQFPQFRLNLSNLRSSQIIAHIQDMRLDVGVWPGRKIPAGLRGVSLGEIEYAIFMHKELSAIGESFRGDWISRIPFATLGNDTAIFSGKAAGAAGLGKINARLICESFTEACSAVAAGRYAAVLPVMAAKVLPEPLYVFREWPGLRSLSRPISLLWNPRVIQIRPESEKCLKWLSLNLNVMGLSKHNARVAEGKERSHDGR